MSFREDIERAEDELRIVRLADLLVRAYYKTGSMSVMLNDGRSLTGRPSYTTDSYTYSRNIHDKALSMARLAVQSPRKPITIQEHYEPNTSRF